MTGGTPGMGESEGDILFRSIVLRPDAATGIFADCRRQTPPNAGRPNLQEYREYREYWIQLAFPVFFVFFSCSLAESNCSRKPPCDKNFRSNAFS